MRKKIEWSWESLDESTWRSKVIGGWLVLHIKTVIIEGKSTSMIQSESMVFVSDRDHEWSIALPFDPSDPGKKHAQHVNPDDFKG